MGFPCAESCVIKNPLEYAVAYSIAVLRVIGGTACGGGACDSNFVVRGAWVLVEVPAMLLPLLLLC